MSNRNEYKGTWGILLLTCVLSCAPAVASTAAPGPRPAPSNHWMRSMESSLNAVRQIDADRDPAILPGVPQPPVGAAGGAGWVLAAFFVAMLVSMRMKVKRGKKPMVRDATQPDFFLWNSKNGERRRHAR